MTEYRPCGCSTCVITLFVRHKMKQASGVNYVRVRCFVSVLKSAAGFGKCGVFGAAGPAGLEPMCQDTSLVACVVLLGDCRFNYMS